MAIEPNWLNHEAFGLAVDANYVYWTDYAGIGRASYDKAVNDPAFVKVPEPIWLDESKEEGSGTTSIVLDDTGLNLYFAIDFSGHPSEEEPEPNGTLAKFGTCTTAGTGLDRFWLAHPNPWTEAEANEEGLKNNQGIFPPLAVANGYVYFYQVMGGFEAVPHSENIARAPLAFPVTEESIDWHWTELDNEREAPGVIAMCVEGEYLYFLMFEEKIGRIPLAGGSPDYEWKDLTGQSPAVLAAGGDGFVYWGTEDGVVGRKSTTEGFSNPKLFQQTGLGYLAVGEGYLFFTVAAEHIGRWELSTAKALTPQLRAQTLTSRAGPTASAASLNRTPHQQNQIEKGEEPSEEAAPSVLERLDALTRSGFDLQAISAVLNVTPQSVVEAQAWPTNQEGGFEWAAGETRVFGFGTLAEAKEAAELSGEEITYIGPTRYAEARPSPETGQYTLTERIIKLNEQSFTFPEIAAFLNVTLATVEEILHNQSLVAEEAPEQVTP